MPSQTDTPIKENWRDYVLSPDSQLVSPVKYAVVPKTEERIDHEGIEWKDYEESAVFPEDYNHWVLFDFGVKSAGHIYLQYDEKNLRPQEEGEHHEEFDVDIISGPDIRLVLFKDTIRYNSGAKVWVDPQFRAFRYLGMSSSEKAGKNVSPLLQFTGYPGDYKGYFYCSNDLLNKIWYTGVYTIQICTQPHEYSGCYNHRLPSQFGDFPANWRSPYGRYVIWDGPRRDREVWIGDMWPECLSLMYSFHGPEVMRSSLAAVSNRQQEDGLIPGSGITLQPFAEYSCWWMTLLSRYYLLTKDDAFIQDMQSTLTRGVEWLIKGINGNNGYLHIDHRRTWAWTLLRRGEVTGSQCVAVAALRGSADLLDLLGNSQLASEARKVAEQLAEKIRTELWDDEAGAFKDSLNPIDGVVRYPCDANSLAVLFGIANDDQKKRAFAFLKENMWTEYGTRTIYPPEPDGDFNWAHNHNIWPFVVGLELEARFEAGDFAGAMELSRICWGNMVEKNATAFWEMVSGEDGDFVTHRPVTDMNPDWDSWDSYSHGWSAGITYLFQAFLLGIYPTKPGFEEFSFKPNLQILDFIEGAVPTPHGRIWSRIKKNGEKITGTLHVPHGTTAKVVIPGKSEQTFGPGKHEL